MKTGWEYKKLGDISTIAAGQGAPQGDANYSTQGTPFIKAGNLIDLINGVDENDIQKVTDDVAKSHKLRLYPSGSILFAKSGMSCMKGYVYTTKNDCYVVSHLAIITPKCINSSYLNYFLQVKKPNSLVKDEAYPSISLKDISDIDIPYPSAEQQQSIVTELDTLSAIIADHKAQLKDYDALEQSIFYDMFGDPVKNDKGWDVKKLGEVGNIQRGSGLSKKDLVEEGYPCILYGQIHTKFGAYIKKHIACIPKDLVCTAKIAHYGDLVMAITSEDVEGSCKSTAWMGDYDIAVGSDAAIFRHNQNGIYVSYYTRTNAFYHEKAKYARGFKVTHISTKEIETIPILLPPLPLQQQFASKIEAIENMKSETKKALQEAETLFQARMDYWFN